MPKATLYNVEGKEKGSIELSDKVFGIKSKNSVVHEVYIALESNRREPWAHTKDKSDVRGGGRKPWKQKGTGRARHGSNRSPIWKGGGVTFGPLSIRNYKKRINKKVKQLALRMCLSDKVVDSKLIVLEDLPTDGKTRTVNDLRNTLPGAGKSTLVIGVDTDEKTGFAVRNVPRLNLQRAIDVNVSDLLNHQYIVVSKKGVEVLEKRLG